MINVYADLSLKKSDNYHELETKFNILFTGGAVMNALNVLQGEKACYFKYPKKENGGCAIWDLAAVSLIFKEAGSVMTSFNGEDLLFNKSDTLYFNEEGLVACSHKNVHEEVQKLLNE